MKLAASFVVALAGCAAASSQQAAEVFLIPAVDSSTPPALIPSLARLLLLHRLSPNGRGLSSTDIPPGIDTERAVSILNQFGKATAPLFADEHVDPPSQLVLMLDGMNDKQMKELRKALDATPTFTIADPPASEAHKDLIEMDLRRAGAADGNRCSIQQVLNPLEECWDGKQSAIAKHDIYEV